jgi:hypothetical protein
MSRNQENRTLSLMLKKCFSICVPLESLDSLEQTRTLGDVLKVVIPLLPAPETGYVQSIALEKRVIRVVMASYTRTKHAVVFNFACLKCGRRLGAEGLRLGNEQRSRYLDEFRAEHPGQLISVFWDIDAVCPQCGCEYAYDSRECSLTLREGNEAAALPSDGPGTRPASPGSAEEPPSVR